LPISYTFAQVLPEHPFMDLSIFRLILGNLKAIEAIMANSLYKVLLTIKITLTQRGTHVSIDFNFLCTQIKKHSRPT
jgi:hypothetical protein